MDAVIEKTCECCGNRFETRRKVQRFCSRKCSNLFTKDSPERVEKLRSHNLNNYKRGISKDKLEELYIKKGMTVAECAKALGQSYATVRVRLHRYGIKVRTKAETKLGENNPRYGKPGTMLGKKHSLDTRKKLSEHLLKNPRKYWEGKKRPEMANVKGFGDHKGKSFEEIMGDSKKAEKRKREMSVRFKNNPEIPRKMAIELQKNISKYKKSTKIELKIKNGLIEAGLEEDKDFIHQYDFLDKGKFSCDFAIPSCKLVIECDGDYWHGNPKLYKKSKLNETQIRNKKFDKAKTAYIKKCGWKVIRFWGSEINSNIAQCIDNVLKEYHARNVYSR